MASVSCATEYRIASGKVVKTLERDAYSTEQSLDMIMQGLDVEPLSTESYDGPPPENVADFRDFVNHHWTRVSSKFGASYIFISRRLFSTQTLEIAELTGAHPPELTAENVDTTFPTFCCFTDGKVHVTLEYWGHPENHPSVRITPLLQRPGEKHASFEFQAT